MYLAPTTNVSTGENTAITANRLYLCVVMLCCFVDDLLPGVVVISLEIPDVSFYRRVSATTHVATFTETLPVAETIESSAMYETSLTNCN